MREPQKDVSAKKLHARKTRKARKTQRAWETWKARETRKAWETRKARGACTACRAHVALVACRAREAHRARPLRPNAFPASLGRQECTHAKALPLDDVRARACGDSAAKRVAVAR